jgi:hypothetical protein
MAVVARLLRGEPLELVARETNVSIARLTEWLLAAVRFHTFFGDGQAKGGLAICH